MNLGDRIIHANKTVEPEEMSRILFAALFEVGPNRLSAHHKHVALETIKAGLIEWKKQLTTTSITAYEDEKRRSADLKRELDELKLKYAIALKELGRVP